MKKHYCRDGGSKGVAYLEIIIVLPVIFLFLSLIIQVGLYFTLRYKVTRMAYEGARMAAGLEEMDDVTCEKNFSEANYRAICEGGGCPDASEECDKLFGRLQDMVDEYEQGSRLYDIDWLSTAVRVEKKDNKIRLRVGMLNKKGIWNLLLNPISKAFGQSSNFFAEVNASAEAPYLLEIE